MCESYGVYLRPAVGVLVVLYSVRLALGYVEECVLCLQVHTIQLTKKQNYIQAEYTK